MLKLAAEKREVFGKKLKPARSQGKLPVVVYGNKTESTPLFVDARDFKKLLAKAGESTMIALDADGKPIDVLVHDVTHHPVTGEPVHADFYAVDKTKAIKIGVPLRFEGVAPAVKELGGILVKVVHELEVETLPMHIPHDIEVDISALAQLDSQILVKDLKLPTGVEALADPEAVVVSIAVAKDEPVEEMPVDLSAIEVEKKGKKEEESLDEARDGVPGEGAPKE